MNFGNLRTLVCCLFFIGFHLSLAAQEDSLAHQEVSVQAMSRVDSVQQFQRVDTVLRIMNLNPFFSLHVDSSLQYQLQINKNPDNYFWYLKNAPVGLRIGKDNGLITFKADKAYFLSGRLKYDIPYKSHLVRNIVFPAA